MQMETWEEESHFDPDPEHISVQALPPSTLCHTCEDPLVHLLVQKTGEMLHVGKSFHAFLDFQDGGGVVAWVAEMAAPGADFQQVFWRR